MATRIRRATSTRWAIRHTWLLFALAATMIGFSVAPIVNDQIGRLNKDYVLWYYTGRAVAQGLPIYPRTAGSFRSCTPRRRRRCWRSSASSARRWFLLVLLALNSVAWVASILLSLYLVSGRVARHHPLLYLVPSLGVAAYIHDTYLLGQPNLGLLACMLGAFACLGAQRSGRRAG